MISFDTESNSDSAEIKLLHYTLDGYWSFPKAEDIHIVDSKFIFYGPTAPAVTSKRGFQFGQHDQDALEIYKLLKNIVRKHKFRKHSVN